MRRLWNSSNCKRPVSALTVFGTNTPEAGSHAIIRLLSSENVTNVTSQSDALKSLRYILPPNIELSGDAGQIIALSKKDPLSGKISYIAVNVSDASKEVTFTSDLAASRSMLPPPNTLFCMDPESGVCQELPVKILSGDRISVFAEIPARGAVMIRL